MLKKTLTRTARAFAFALVTAALTSQVAKADLEVDGTPNGTFNENSVMTYDADPTDPTTVTIGQVLLGNASAGNPNTNSGALTVSSGTLTLTGTEWGTIIGQQNSQGAAVISVSGGTLNLNSPGGDSSLFVGNAGGFGTINLSGGAMNVSANQFVVGRDDAGTGRINITGGLLVANSTEFALSGGNFNGSTSGIVTFGVGAGELRFSNLTTLTINNSGTSYIDFTTGSAGKLSINGYTSSQFESLVTAGSIRVDGAVATASQFSFTEEAGQGTYQLAAVPEPTTLGLFLLSGACVLFLRNRHRSGAQA